MATAPPKPDKKGPDFKLKALEGIETLPPDPARTRNVAYQEIIDNLTTIQATPNTWFEVAHYAQRNGSDKNPTGAKKVVTRLLAKDIKAPGPVDEAVSGVYDLEYRKASYDGSTRDGSVVLAKYVVE